MDWDISFSKQVVKFLDVQHFDVSVVIELLKKAIRKLEGQQVFVDIKKLSGNWTGYMRLRSGKKRIIFSVDFLAKKIFVEVFDFRGNVYK